MALNAGTTALALNDGLTCSQLFKTHLVTLPSDESGKLLVSGSCNGEYWGSPTMNLWNCNSIRSSRRDVTLGGL